MKHMTELKSKAISGVAWSAIERFSVQIIQFVIGLIIARILLPSDYGLIAMVTVFLAIAQCFIDSGFSNALMQKQNRTAEDFITAFYTNIGVAFVFYAIFYVCSPLIAEFYNEPSLKVILRILSLNFVMTSLFLVHRTKMMIEMDFKSMAKIAIAAAVIGGAIGIYMAIKGFGVWALVAQTMSGSLVSLVVYWIRTKWQPKLSFSASSFSYLFNFGSKILLAGLIHTIYSNMYSLVIGKKYSSTDLGFYNRGQSFAYVIPSNLTTIVTQSMYPVLCSLQDDREHLKSAFLSYVRLACFVTFPIAMLLAALAQPVISIVLTDKWLPATLYLQIMCFGYMWDPLMRINANSLSVTGRSDYVLKSETLKKLISVMVLIGSLPFGLNIICIGMAAYSLIDLFISSIFTKKVVGVSFADEMRAAVPYLVTSILLFGIVFVIDRLILSDVLSLVCGTTIGLIFYLLVAFVFKWKELDIVTSTCRNYILKKRLS